MRASAEATAAMIKARGPSYRSISAWFTGAHAGYRGQVGPHPAIPHTITTNVRFKPGDVLVTGASAAVGGYISELERTMVIAPVSHGGSSSTRWRCRKSAFEAIRPGRRCMPYWRHYAGHGLGSAFMRPPFLDVDRMTHLRAAGEGAGMAGGPIRRGST